MQSGRLFSALLLLTGVAEAQETPLKVEILTSRSAYYDFEVISVRIRVRNPSAAPAQLSFNPEDSYSMKAYLAAPDRDFEEAVVRLGAPPSTEPIRKTFEAGASTQTSLPVCLSLKKDHSFQLAAPGSYRLRVDSGKVRSNVLTVEVKDSRSLSESVQRVFRSRDWPIYVLSGGRLDTEQDEKPFLEFYASREESPQGGLLAALVGRMHQEGRRRVETLDPATGRSKTRWVNEPDYPKALEAYGRALATDEPHLKGAVLFQIAECHEKQGDKAQAKRTLELIPAGECNSDLARKSRRWRERLGRD